MRGFDGWAHQLGLAQQAHQAQGRDRAEVHLLSKRFPLGLGLMGRQLGHSSSSWRTARRSPAWPSPSRLDRAVYWFRPRAEQRDIQVLAVFFGGQDHQRHITKQLFGDNGPN